MGWVVGCRGGRGSRYTWPAMPMWLWNFIVVFAASGENHCRGSVEVVYMT